MAHLLSVAKFIAIVVLGVIFGFGLGGALASSIVGIFHIEHLDFALLINQVFILFTTVAMLGMFQKLVVKM